MVESATSFIKSGYSEEDSAKLAQTAELFRNIADSEISSAESANFIISQMKAFGYETEEFALHSVNAINEVSNNMAVSSTDISTALSKTSSAMGALGNTYEETIGLVTAGAEIMQGQSSKVARGLRSIGNQISNLAQQQKTLAIETQNGTKQIQLFDEATGDMRSTYDILGDIAKQWDNMSNAQKQAIGISLANKTQFETFTAVVGNFADAQKAVTYATDSENSALDENARFLESISAKTNLAKSGFQELVLGDGGLTDFVKILLDATNALLKLANSGFGKAIINLTLFTTAIVLCGKALQTNAVQGIIAFITNLKVMIATEGIATVATKGLKIALDTLSSHPIVALFTLIAGAGLALYKVMQKLKTGIKDVGDALNESLSDLDSSTQNIDELKDKIAEINQNKLKVTDEEELRNLDIQQAKLESQLLVEQAIADEKERQLKADAKKAMNTIGWSYGYREGTHSVAETGYGAYGGTVDENLKNQIEDINNLNKEIDEYRQQQKYLMDTFAENGKLNEHYQKQYDNLSNSISTASDNLTKLTANSAENVNVVQAVIDANGDEDGSLKELIETWSNAVKQSDEVKDSQLSQEEILKQTAEAYGLTAEAVKSYMDANDVTDITEACEALSQNAENAEDVAKAYEDAVSAVDGMEDAFASLNDAVTEYNSTGQLSLDTINDLLSMDNEYLSLLELENGQMGISAENALKLANAKIDEAEATAIQEAQTELAKIKAHEYNSVLVESAMASSVAVQSAQSAGQAILASGEDALTAQKMWAECWKTISNGYEFTNKQDKAYAKEVEQSLKNRITTLESLRGNVGKVTSATNANTKSTKGNTKAQNENTKALKERLEVLKETKQNLEDTKKQYDDVISYIEGKLSDAIKALEDARDKELDVLEEAYDREQEYWQAKIDVLKEANGEVEKQIELEELLAQLERAKASKKMIYREGQGFVYEADQEEISTAQRNLQEYYRKRKYEEALKELEDYIANSKAKYDEDVKNVKKNYQDKIDYLQKYLDEFKKGVNAYENEQKRQQAIILTGIDFEKNAWETQLGNLRNFVQRYSELQAQIAEATRQVTEAQKAYNDAVNQYNSTTANGIPTARYTPTTSASTQTQTHPYEGMIGKYYSWKKGVQYANLTTHTIGKTETQGTHTMHVTDVIREGNGTYWAVGTNVNGNQIKIKISDLMQPLRQGLYASGTYGIKEDGIAVVGDDPKFSELVIGSKLNSGAKILNASKGTGVIPHNLTSTLVSMAQAFQGQQPLQTTNNSTATNISIGNITLPSVENGEQFVDYLQNFNLDMTILAYAR